MYGVNEASTKLYYINNLCGMNTIIQFHIYPSMILILAKVDNCFELLAEEEVRHYVGMGD